MWKGGCGITSTEQQQCVKNNVKDGGAVVVRGTSDVYFCTLQVEFPWSGKVQLYHLRREKRCTIAVILKSSAYNETRVNAVACVFICREGASRLIHCNQQHI